MRGSGGCRGRKRRAWPAPCYGTERCFAQPNSAGVPTGSTHARAAWQDLARGGPWHGRVFVGLCGCVGVQRSPVPTSTGSPVPGRAVQPHVLLTPGLCPRFTTYLAGTFGTGRGGLASARVRDGRQLGRGEGLVTGSPGSGRGGSSRGPGRGVSHGAEAGGEGRAVAHVPPGVGGWMGMGCLEGTACLMGPCHIHRG